MAAEPHGSDEHSASILVVDDEPGVREGCRRVLTAEGYATEGQVRDTLTDEGRATENDEDAKEGAQHRSAETPYESSLEEGIAKSSNQVHVLITINGE